MLGVLLRSSICQLLTLFLMFSIDKNIGMSSGSDTESLNISAGVDTTDDQSGK